MGADTPTQVTPTELAAMAAADENHRYELSPEGMLSVTPPADPDHALLVSRIFVWLVTHGYGPQHVILNCGIDLGGARVPDLTVWAEGRPPRRARSSYAGTDGLLLAVEVISDASTLTDRITKRAEYAKAGIPHYWFVDQDTGATVHRHTLNPSTGEYGTVPPCPQPLSWLLSTVPDLS